MSARQLALSSVVVVSALLLASRAALGDVSGERGRPIVMQGVLEDEQGRERARLSVEIERVSFVLNSVQGRFRLARLRVENLGASPVALSVDRDRLEAEQADGGRVPAILNLQSSDSAFWDGLAAELRQALAYPQSVRGASGPGGRPEVVYVYALFPADRLIQVPAAFVYRIESTGQAIRIEHRATAARR